MDVEKWLGQAIWLEARYKALHAKRERWTGIYDRCAALVEDVEGVDASKDIISLRNAFLEEVDHDLDDLNRYRVDVLCVIDNVRDERLRLFLQLRYLKGLTFLEISEQMHYSIEWVFKLRKKSNKVACEILRDRLPDTVWEVQRGRVYDG